MKDSNKKKAEQSLTPNNLTTSTSPTIEETINYVRNKHAEQIDHNGKPYINHLIRVTQNVLLLNPQASEDVIKAALLHDIIEDCDDIEENTLKESGYPDKTLDIIKLVTKPPNDRRPYPTIIDNIIASGNKGAMLVKLADSLDNSNAHRMEELRKTDPQKAERLTKKYKYSVEQLSKALNINPDACNTIARKEIKTNEELVL